MSTVVRLKPSAKDALKKVTKHLALEDTKRLSDALLIVAAELSVHNDSVADRVRAIYAALPTTPVRAKTTKPSITDFIPVKRVEGFVFDGIKPLDPYLLYEAYGAQQLPQILNFLSLSRLKETASIVETHNPGTKPSNRGQKTSIIDYIVKYVTTDA
jgi:hypothetical protein